MIPGYYLERILRFAIYIGYTQFAAEPIFSLYFIQCSATFKEIF